MSDSSSLSKRGQIVQNTTLRVDFEIFYEAMQNLFHQTDNPDGAIPLNIAENRLSWHLLENKMKEITENESIPNWVASYTSAMGAPEFRSVLADFLTKFLTLCPINPDHLGLSAGATAIVEVSSWVVADPGDVAVFPAPCYPVYKQDIGNKGGIERYDLVTHYDLTSIKNEPVLSIEHLEQALQEIERAGKKFKMLVLTNPDNPTGGMFSKAKLESIADWCIGHKIHLFVNEIYGLSLIDILHPAIKDDYDTEIDFFSFANIIQDRQSDYLHLWHALSKDFGASGFRVGMVYSLNQAFLEAYNNLNAPQMVSNFAQWIFLKVMEDHDFIADYIEYNQKALTESYIIVIESLRRLNIPYAPARGSLFVWLDFSEFLKEQSQEAENEMWMNIYNETKVLLTPGQGFGHSKRGQFRLVYSCVSKEELSVAMERLEKWVLKKRA
ncbi:MAG: aminotransferase class I/II-fold pyridoxal phosphate-dependent enzyme [Bacteroidota bacterium]